MLYSSVHGIQKLPPVINVQNKDCVHVYCCHGCLLFPTAGSDYTSLTDYALSFAAGSPVNSLSCVDIVILEDSAVEDIERFYVELSTSDPVNFLSHDHAPVSILGKSEKPVIANLLLAIVHPLMHSIHNCHVRGCYSKVCSSHFYEIENYFAGPFCTHALRN